MVDICNEVDWDKLGFTIMGDPGVFGGDEGALFGIPRCINFVGENLLVPAKGYCVHLSTRVNLHSHALGPILCGEHEAGVAYDLAIQCIPC